LYKLNTTATMNRQWDPFHMTAMARR